MRNSLFILLIAVVILPMLLACEHKELCYAHPHYELELVFDWSDAPDADPAAMCVYFYSEDRDAEPYVFYILGKEGATITLPRGTYSIIAYNSDTDGVLYSGITSFSTHSLYTREGSITESADFVQGVGKADVPRPASSANERVVITPDEMWGCSETGVVVYSERDVPQTITLYPHQYTCHYTYEIRNVKNMEYVSRMSCALSGMSGLLNASTERCSTEPVTLALTADGKDSTIFGEFFTFGYDEEAEIEKRLMLYVWSTDGVRTAYGVGSEKKYNVTEQIRTAPDPRNVHIIIEDGPELHISEIEGSGGFVPDVDDWGEENADIFL